MIASLTMTDSVRPLHYRSYLLRFWEEHSADSSLGVLPPAERWRFSLEDPHSGARLGFANIDQLVAFLEDQIQSNSKREAAP